MSKDIIEFTRERLSNVFKMPDSSKFRNALENDDYRQYVINDVEEHLGLKDRDKLDSMIVAELHKDKSLAETRQEMEKDTLSDTEVERVTEELETTAKPDTAEVRQVVKDKEQRESEMVTVPKHIYEQEKERIGKYPDVFGLEQAPQELDLERPESTTEELTKSKPFKPSSVEAIQGVEKFRQKLREPEDPESFREKLYSKPGQIKWIGARIFSSILERPGYAMAEGAARILKFTRGEWLADIIHGDKEKTGPSMTEQFVNYYAHPEKHGFTTPYAAKGSSVIRKDTYNRSYYLGVLNDMAEAGTDIAGYIAQVQLMGKITPSAPATLFGGSKLSALGNHLTRIGVHGFVTTPGGAQERLKSTIKRIGYNITPYIAQNGFGLTGISAQAADTGLNTFLTSPTYAKMIQEAGGLNKEFLAMALPQFVTDFGMALGTRGLPKDIRRKRVNKYLVDRLQEFKIPKAEAHRMIQKFDKIAEGDLTGLSAKQLRFQITDPRGEWYAAVERTEGNSFGVRFYKNKDAAEKAAGDKEGVVDSYVLDVKNPLNAFNMEEFAMVAQQLGDRDFVNVFNTVVRRGEIPEADMSKNVTFNAKNLLNSWRKDYGDDKVRNAIWNAGFDGIWFPIGREKAESQELMAIAPRGEINPTDIKIEAEPYLAERPGALTTKDFNVSRDIEEKPKTELLKHTKNIKDNEFRYLNTLDETVLKNVLYKDKEGWYNIDYNKVANMKPEGSVHQIESVLKLKVLRGEKEGMDVPLRTPKVLFVTPDGRVITEINRDFGSRSGVHVAGSHPTLLAREFPNKSDKELQKIEENGIQLRINDDKSIDIHFGGPNVRGEKSELIDRASRLAKVARNYLKLPGDTKVNFWLDHPTDYGEIRGYNKLSDITGKRDFSSSSGLDTRTEPSFTEEARFGLKQPSVHQIGRGAIQFSRAGEEKTSIAKLPNVRGYESIDKFFERKQSPGAGPVRLANNAEVGRISSIMHYMNPPSNTKVSFEQSIVKRSGELNLGMLVANNMAKNISRAVKKYNLKDAQGKILDYIEDDRISDLGKHEREVAELYVSMMKAGKEWAKANGILESFLDNYVYHMYKDSDKKVRAAFFTSGSGQLATRATPTSKRKLETRRVAREKHGLTPVDDMGTLVAAWWSSMYRVNANKKFLDGLDGVVSKEGLPILSGEKLPGYKFIQEPQLSRGLKSESGAYVHPDFVDGFKTIGSNRGDWGAWRKSWFRTTANIKRAIMHNPLFHTKNIYSDLLDELNFRAIKAGRVILKGVKEKELKKYGFESKEELHKEMAKKDISMDIAHQASREMYDMMTSVFSETDYNAKTAMGKVIERAKAFSDRALWGNVVQNSQDMLYMLKKAKFMKDGLSEEKAGYAAGHYVNDMFGTLSRTVFTRNQAESMNFLFFARNWTISNMRLLTGAMGVRSNIAPRFLRHEGLDKDQMEVLQREYRKHLIKGVMGLMVSNTILNYTLSGQMPWENEKGHMLDINTGQKDHKGRPIYVSNLLFAYIRDQIGWGYEMKRTALNKIEPLLKTSVESFMNYSTWMYENISKPGSPDWDKAKDHAKYFIRGVTPIGTYGENSGEVKHWIEKVVPFFGTWVSHGTPGGEAGRKAHEFRIKEGYKRNELLEKLEEYTQKGQWDKAADYALENDLYKDVKSLYKRLLKFDNRVAYDFDQFSHEHKIEVLYNVLDHDEAIGYIEDMLNNKKYTQYIMSETTKSILNNAYKYHKEALNPDKETKGDTSAD